MNIPGKIIQGDTVAWRDNPSRDALGNSISAPEWTLTYYFSGPTQFHVVAVADDAGWAMSLTSQQTAAMTPVQSIGAAPNYYWQATAHRHLNHGTPNTEKITIGTGTLTVLQNLATAPAGFDGRTQSEKDLAAVQNAIQTRISGGAVSEYVIGTRRLKNEPLSELLALESRLKLVVSRERQAQAIANGLGDPRNTYVRFS